MTADRARPEGLRLSDPPARGPSRPCAAAGWALASAALAPVGMIGGWTVAAAAQVAPFDPVRDTISALATSAATSGWVMTVGLAITGACHLGTAAGLRGAAPLGRTLLALGGAATLAVAAMPVDAVPGGHGLAAGVAFVALSIWPAAAVRRRPPGVGRDGVLGPRWSAAASGVLVGTLVWFVLELQGSGPAGGLHTGLSERVLAGAQSLWPLVVVLGLRTSGRSAGATDTPGAVVGRVAP